MLAQLVCDVNLSIIDTYSYTGVYMYIGANNNNANDDGQPTNRFPQVDIFGSLLLPQNVHQRIYVQVYLRIYTHNICDQHTCA